MAAAADQLIVVPWVPGESRRGAQKGKCLGEAARGEQGETVDPSVDTREAVHWAHSQRLAGLFDRRLELASAEQRPSERRPSEREVGVDVERRSKLDERLLVVSRGAQAQAKNHPSPGLRRIEGKSLLGMPLSLSLLVALLKVRPPVGLRRPPDCPAQDGMRLRITRLNLDGALQQGLRLLVLPLANSIDQAERTDDETPGVDALGRLVRRAEALFLVEVRLDRGDDVAGDFILDSKNVAQLAVVPLGPDVLAGRCVNQLPRYADLPTRGPDAAFEDITDRELEGNLADVDGSSLVGEGRIARDNEQPAQAGERRCNILGDPVREIFLFEITAHIRERQYRDRRCIGCRQNRAGRCGPLRARRCAQRQLGVILDDRKCPVREQSDQQLINRGFAELCPIRELLARYPLAREVIPDDGGDPLPVVHSRLPRI